MTDRDEQNGTHYEAFPYPERDPADEASRLVVGSPSTLAEVEHYLFSGRSVAGRPFRALVAGGGTGDAAIMLGQQLADAGGEGEVVYLDPSRRAREIAESRATARNLRSVSFRTGAIEDLPGLGLGAFDYVDCCGVLHHLADPAAGLATLAQALAPNGGMGIMVYGALGRTGVYEAQEMLHRISAGLTPDEKVALARRLLAALPDGNWLKRNPAVGDQHGSDAAIYDLLLHERDRAFDVAGVLDLLAAADLRAVSFIEPIRYEPATYLSDPVLQVRAALLTWPERAALAERLAGNLRKHVLYATRGPNGHDTVARPDEPSAVPRLMGLDAAAAARAVAAQGALSVTMDGLRRRFALPPLAPAIIAQIDGRRTVDEIFAVANTGDPTLDRSTFDQAFEATYKVLNGLNLLLLRTRR